MEEQLVSIAVKAHTFLIVCQIDWVQSQCGTRRGKTPRLSELTLAAAPHGPGPPARPGGTTVPSPPHRAFWKPLDPACRQLSGDRRAPRPLAEPGPRTAACRSHWGATRRGGRSPGPSRSGRGRGSACGTGPQLALRSWLGPHFEADIISF